MTALQELLPLLDVLRRVWSVERFGRAVARDSDEAREVRQGEVGRVMSVEVIQEALTSNLFAAYARAMAGVADVLQHLQRWCESCPCPAHANPEEKSKCPLKSRRAPELAAGIVHDIFQVLLND